MYKVVIERQAQKYLDRIDTVLRFRILQSLYTYAQTGENGSVVKMQGMAGVYRMRIGDYRVVFEKNDTIRLISILKIGPRGDIYK